MRENVILDKSKNFGILASKYYLALKDKRYFEIASQFFRAGTSIGANITEAQGAVSNADFINKLSISLKEAYETEYWIYILKNGFGENNNELEILSRELFDIISILTKIIKTSKSKN